MQGSIKWHFDKDHKIRIELLDESYRLQKFLELNNYFLKSKEVFSGFRDQVKKIKQSVEQTKEEFSESSTIDFAYKGCLREAELKLSNYHSFLTDNTELDGYSVGQFRNVYTYILARAVLKKEGCLSTDFPSNPFLKDPSFFSEFG